MPFGEIVDRKIFLIGAGASWRFPHHGADDQPVTLQRLIRGLRRNDAVALSGQDQVADRGRSDTRRKRDN